MSVKWKMDGMNKRFFMTGNAAVLAALLALAVYGCTAKEMETPKQAPAPAAEVTLPNLSGNMVSISQFKGRPLIVNFWASWCTPCIAEMPEFQKIYDAWKSKGLEILAINMKEPKDVAAEFMKKNGYSFQTLLDESGKASEQFQVFGLPTTFFIDDKGIVRFKHMGQLTKEIIFMGLESISLS